MKKRIVAVLVVSLLSVGVVFGCGAQPVPQENTASSTSMPDESKASLEASSDVSSDGNESIDSVDSRQSKTEENEESEDAKVTKGCDLADGTYTAAFNTDSGMFHVNEACEGKGVLTVKDGFATIHVSLVSKNIVNLFVGTAEDAQKDGSVLLEPTTDEVTYADGYTDTVYGFDVPLPVLEEEFDLALIGKKGKWYDHKVSVTDVTAE